MKNELDVLRDVSGKLEELGIAYMLTGSMAMNYYATPRMTRYIDLVVELTASDVSRLIDRFEPEYYVSSTRAHDAVSRRKMFEVIHQETVIKVDCIVRKDDDYRRTEFDRRARVEIGEFTTFLVSKEDLILSKLEWAADSRSELQLKDVRNLMSTGYDTQLHRALGQTVERPGAIFGDTRCVTPRPTSKKWCVSG